jgi:hypothetical protein
VHDDRYVVVKHDWSISVLDIESRTRGTWLGAQWVRTLAVDPEDGSLLLSSGRSTLAIPVEALIRELLPVSSDEERRWLISMTRLSDARLTPLQRDLRLRRLERLGLLPM